MEDISQNMSTATSTPEDAANNIRNSTIFDTQPTDDQHANQLMSQSAQQALKPTEAEPAVKDYVSQSSQHASLASPDIEKLNYVERLTKYFGDKIGDQYTVGQRTAALAFKKLANNGKLSDADEGELWQLNQDKEAIGKRNYDLSGHEAPPRDAFDVGPEAVEGGKDVAKFATDVLADTINFGRMAGRGIYEGVVNSNPRSIHDMVGNAVLGGLGFKHFVGATYNELPEEMDEATKRHISVGMGLTHAGINAAMTFGGGVLNKMFPFINSTLTPKFVAMAMEAPENAVMKMAIHNIGHSALMMGGAGGAGEVANIVRDEMVKNYDGTHASFVNALVSASQNAGENASRVGKAALQGAEAGIVLGAFGQIASAGKMRSQVDAIAQRGQEFLSNLDIVSNHTRITGKPGEEAPDLQPTIKDVGPNGPKGPARPWTPPPTEPEIGEEVHPQQTVNEAVDTLQFHQGLHDINDVMNSTNMAKVSPEERLSVLQKIFDKSGITKFYTTMTNLRMFARDEESVQKVQNFIDPTGKLAANMNAMVGVDPVKVMDIAAEDPKILDHMAPKPKSPVPLQAKEHLENLMQAEQRRNDLFAAHGIKPEEVQPEEPSNVKPIGEKPKVEKPPYDLESDARRTQELLNQIKGVKERQKEREILLNDSEGNPKIGPNEKELRATLDYADKADKKNLKAFTDELEEIKARVVDNFKKPEPGKVVFGHWPEPGIEESKNTMTGYLNAPTFTEALRKALPKAEVEQFDKATEKARVARATNIADAAKYEMDKIHDIEAGEMKEIRHQMELDRIANDPNYDIVEKFRNTKNVETKKSIFQIDPKSLTKDQLEFADHYRMKEHGVFAKGGKGISADSAAQLLGVKDGSTLLQILAQTPTREQVAAARAEANRITDEKAIRDKDDLNHTKIIEAIRDTAKNHLEEMKFMREQEWPALKKQIKRIALPLPKIEELEERARAAVWKMKVGDLNGVPRQFEVGEARSNRVAITSLLDGEIERAYEAKEAAAMNALIRKEAMVRIGLINRGFNFFDRINSKSGQQVLKDAGKFSYNAMTEIQDLFKLSRSKAGQSELGSFRKWMTREVNAGRGDFSIPERLSSLQQSANDLTVEQFMVVLDRAKVIWNEARTKNKLKGIIADREEERAKEDWERQKTEIIQRAETHPGFDSNRTKPPSGPMDYRWMKFKSKLSAAEAGIAGIHNIVREMDQGKTGGFWHQLLMEQFEGSGKYYGKEGYTYNLNKSEWINHWAESAAKTVKDFDNWEKTWLDIQEFHGVKELNFGKMTKADLIGYYMYRGHDYTNDLLKTNNGGIDEATWTTVHDRYLTKEDKDLAHVVMNKSKDFRPEIKARADKAGRDLEFIEGRQYPDGRIGAWVRARYQHDYTRGAAEKLKDFLSANDTTREDMRKGGEFGQNYADATTHQGYLTQRVGSNQPLDPSLHGFFKTFHEIAHDLSYWAAGENRMKLFADREIYDAMVKMVGQDKVNTMIYKTIEHLGQPSESMTYSSNFNRMLQDGYRKFGRNFAVTTLWLNLGTVKKQTEAYAEQFHALGPKGMWHFTKANWTMLRNFDRVGGFLEMAEQLDPNMRKYYSGVEDTTMATIDGIIPKKGGVLSLPKSLTPVEAAGKWAQSSGFSLIAATDYYMKALQSHTILSMVQAGDHPDITKEEFENLSDKEQIEKIQSMVQQMSTFTQIQSRAELQATIQGNPLTRLVTMFWNYRRNILNNTLLDARRAKWKAESAYENAKEGEYKEAGKDFATGTGIILSRMLFSMMGLAITKWAAGKTYDFGKKTINSMDDLAEWGEGFLGHLMMSPVEQAADVTPLVSDFKWALENHRKKYQEVHVSNPLSKSLDDVGTALSALPDLLKWGHLNKFQKRALLQSESLFFQPIPVNAYYKSMKYLSEPTSEPSEHSGFSMEGLKDIYDSLKSFVSNPPEDVHEKFVKQIDQLADQIKPEVALVPKGAADSIKNAMSGGDWSKPNGLYGFTEEQWSQIQRQAPELGLTDAGRIAKNTGQQEKAIDWSLKDNAEKLAKDDLPVNTNTLFGAHKLGLENYEKLYAAPADTKLKTVLSESFLSKNPEIAQFKTVGQVKQFLNEKVRKDQSAQLTQPQPPTEDKL